MKQAIAFVTPPFLWPSLPLPGVAYLADRARFLGFETRLFDLNGLYYQRLVAMKKDWTVNRDYIRAGSLERLQKLCPEVLEALYDELQKGDFAYVGVSLFKSNFHFALAMSRELKKRFPHVKILWGGPEVFSLYLNDPDFRGFPFVDHFVVGEGEKPLEEILEQRAKRIYLFEQQKELQAFPRYDHLDLGAYPRRGCLPIVASRGCVNRCAFCTEKHLFKGYRFRLAQDILAEMEFHRLENRIGHFIFYDSLFNGHLKNIEALCQGILKKHLKCTWEAQIAIRPAMDLELMKLMKAAGCVNLFIGLESGSEEVLRKMKKPFTIEEASAFFSRLSRAGLQFEVSLITAYPGEEGIHHRETLAFLKQHSKVIPKIAQVSAYQEYPGTESGSAQDGAIARQRLGELRDLFITEGIPFTPAYIDNLV